MNSRGTGRGTPTATTTCLGSTISLEYRNTWTHTDVPPATVFQPVLGHKVACLGRSQARMLESWGNLGKCEAIGAPRLDVLLGRRPRVRAPGEPLRIGIMTAKRPGFNEGQAVVTTPSTAMLEAMLHGLPVSLLDYNNCPHFVPAAWSITARDHMDPVLRELLAPPAQRMLYQDTVLHDALECRTPAAPRMAQLVTDIVRIGWECRRRGEPLVLPARVIPDEFQRFHCPEGSFDLRRLFPDHPVFANLDRAALHSELVHAYHQIAQQQDQIARQQDQIGQQQLELDAIHQSWICRILRKTHRVASLFRG